MHKTSLQWAMEDAIKERDRRRAREVTKAITGLVAAFRKIVEAMAAAVRPVVEALASLAKALQRRPRPTYPGATSFEHRGAKAQWALI